MHYLYRYICILNVFYKCIWTIVCNKEFIYYLDINQLGYGKKKCDLWWSAHS